MIVKVLTLSFSCLTLELLTSCEKQKDEVQLEVAPLHASIQDPSRTMRFYYYTHGDCFSPRRNCLPDVIIQYPIPSIVAGGLTQLEEAAYSGSGAVKEFFTNGPWRETLPYLQEEPYNEVVTKLQSGEYAIRADHFGERRFFCAGPGATAAAVSETEPEFVIPVLPQE